jgi:hypothetical protein
MHRFDDDHSLSPRHGLLVLGGLTVALWSFPSALVYGVLQLL